MKFYFTVILSFLLNSYTFSQSTNRDLSISISGGNFSVGHDYIKGIWTGLEIKKSLSKSKENFLSKITAGGEIYFENGADKATIYNPTPSQFVHERYFHESNSALAAKLTYYPFRSFLRGLHFSAGPLIVYSIRTFEKRGEIIQYGPDTFVRMSEIESDNKLLGGYRLTGGYTIYFINNWFLGIRADLEQFHDRDLNSLLGATVGFHF